MSIDETKIKTILSSCIHREKLYTKIGGGVYELKYFRCDVGEQKILFDCPVLNDIFSSGIFESFKRGADGNKYDSFDRNDEVVLYNIASIPNFRLRTWEPKSVEIDFWNNLSFTRPKTSGGRRKNSRAKKSRKNRRTRTLRH